MHHSSREIHPIQRPSVQIDDDWIDGIFPEFCWQKCWQASKTLVKIIMIKLDFLRGKFPTIIPLVFFLYLTFACHSAWQM